MWRVKAQEWRVRVQCNVVKTCFDWGGARQLSTLPSRVFQLRLGATADRQSACVLKVTTIGGGDLAQRITTTDVSDGTFNNNKKIRT